MKVTYEEMLKQFIDILNKESNEHFPIIYSYQIGKYQKELELSKSVEDATDRLKAGLPLSTKCFRTIKLNASHTGVGQRCTIYESHFIANNPATFLHSLFREKLCYELIYTGFYKVVSDCFDRYADFSVPEESTLQKTPPIESGAVPHDSIDIDGINITS